jgi:hypothetical protein
MALFDPEKSFSPVFARARPAGLSMPPRVDFASISLTKPGSLAQAATRDKYILKARGSAGILDWHPEPAKRLLYRQLSLRMRLIRFTAFKSVVFDIGCNLDRLVEKTCAGAGINRALNPGGPIKTYPDLGQIDPDGLAEWLVPPLALAPYLRPGMLRVRPRSSEKGSNHVASFNRSLRSNDQTSLTSFFRIPMESRDISRQIAINSTTSIRRSPASYLATND